MEPAAVSAAGPGPEPRLTTPAPAHCYLCAGSDLTLRFPARHPTAAPAAFNCTSFGHRRHPPIWACRGCGLHLQHPPRAEADLVEAYRQVEDPLYLAERENRYFTFRRVVGQLGPPEGRRLLDVGAYCGYFVDVARQAGFEAEGLELSTWAAGQARTLGLTIHEHTLAERRAAGARYDVITMWDVVEHLADPRAELATALGLLEPGGQLHLSTIDVSSRLARLLGARWPWLMDMHLFYFDRRTLPALLESVGFRVTSVRDYTHVVSLRYLLEKAAASFAVARPLRLLRPVTPARWRVPVNLGDNMLVSAERPA